jgi:hypothetical protein
MKKLFILLGFFLAQFMKTNAQEKGLGGAIIANRFSDEVIYQKDTSFDGSDVVRKKSLMLPKFSLFYYKTNKYGNYRTFFSNFGFSNRKELFVNQTRFEKPKVKLDVFDYQIFRSYIEVGTTKFRRLYHSKNNKFNLYYGVTNALIWNYKDARQLTTVAFPFNSHNIGWDFRIEPSCTFQLSDKLYLDAMIYRALGATNTIVISNYQNPLLPIGQQKQAYIKSDFQLPFYSNIGIQIGARYVFKVQ